MLSRYRYWIAAGLILLGSVFCWFGLNRPVTVVVDDVPVTVITRAFTPYRILHQLDMPLNEQDRLSPGGNQLLGWKTAIQLKRAVPVAVGISGTPYLHHAVTSERIAANLLFQARSCTLPGRPDHFEWQDGRVSDVLPPAPSFSLLVERGNPLVLADGNSRLQWYSSSATPLAALWEAGYRLQQSDIMPGSSTSWQGIETWVQISEGKPVIILDGEGEWSSRTSASTVGEALASAGNNTERNGLYPSG